MTQFLFRNDSCLCHTSFGLMCISCPPIIEISTHILMLYGNSIKEVGSKMHKFKRRLQTIFLIRIFAHHACFARLLKTKFFVFVQQTKLCHLVRNYYLKTVT